MTRRALLISPAFTVLDDPNVPTPVKETPTETWRDGLGVLLSRVAKTMDGEGVVLLDGAAADALKLPWQPANLEKATTPAGLDDARADGWKVDKAGPWMTFRADRRPTLHVGVTTLIQAARCPLVAPWPGDTVGALRMWHEMTGYAWHGTPGVAGMALMRATAPRVMVRGRMTPPTWKAVGGPAEAREADFSAARWSRPMTTTFEHGYDATRMYLAAAKGCEVLAPWTLRNTGAIDFDPKRAGWWKAELSGWNVDTIPDPAGPGEGLVRWITTPTAVLLSWLVDQGVYGGFRVVDSWTADGKRLFRKWGEVIEATYQAATAKLSERDGDGFPLAVAMDADRVRQAAKEVYREAWGLLNRSSNAVYRPDWHFTILAQARANLWRKVWAVGQAEDRWPVGIDVDNVWYGSEHEDPEQACPRGLVPPRGKTRDQLGQFKVKGTRSSRKGNRA